MAPSPAPPFTRTVCDCHQCVACCHTQPGSLHPGDFDRIVEFLGEDREVAKLHFWASPGAVLGRVTASGLYAFRVGTITPRMTDGRCVFLDDQDRCQIHPVAPFGCAYFDTHMGKAEGQVRGTWHMRGIMADPTYQALRDRLMVATSWAGRFAL